MLYTYIFRESRRKRNKNGDFFKYKNNVIEFPSISKQFALIVSVDICCQWGLWLLALLWIKHLKISAALRSWTRKKKSALLWDVNQSKNKRKQWCFQLLGSFAAWLLLLFSHLKRRLLLSLKPWKCVVAHLISVESKAKSALLRGSQAHEMQRAFSSEALFKNRAFAFQRESKQTRKNSVQN